MLKTKKECTRLGGEATARLDRVVWSLVLTREPLLEATTADALWSNNTDGRLEGAADWTDKVVVVCV